MVQERRMLFTPENLGKFTEILDHGCQCGSCCRRVAIWADMPSITVDDDWLLKVVAKVNFGCKRWCGGSNVEVDVKTGVILDLMGDYISVGIGAIELIQGLEGDTPPEITIGAMSTCCGAGGARGCATRTTARQTVLASSGGITLIPIPPYAYAVQFIDPNNPQTFFASTTIIAFSSSGFGTGILYTTTGDVVPDPLTIPGGALSLLLFNTSADDVLVEAIFLIGV